MSSRQPSLYQALLRNLLPPLAVLVVMIWASLGLVYVSAVYGGQAWINSAKTGTVPQVLELVALQGLSCMQQEVRFGASSCTQDGSAIVYTLDGPAEVIRYEGVPLPAEGLTALQEQIPTSGFAVLGDRAVQVVTGGTEGSGSTIMIRDVTQALLYRLSTAAAVEVELFGDLNSPAMGSTFADTSGQRLQIQSAPPEPDMDWRELDFDRRYRGYPIPGPSGWVFGAGDRSLTAFARYNETPSIPGFQPLVIVVSVPKSVMLGFTNLLLLLSALVVLGIVVWAGWLLRRLTNQQIQPIVALAERVRAFRRTLQSDDVDTIRLQPRASTELEALEFAFTMLEEKVRDNARLESQIRQNERLEAIGRLAGGIAHDFNNLLSIVVVNCNFLEEDLDDPELLESVADINSAAESATEMTKSLLAFSSGRSESVPIGRSISGEVKTAVKLVSRTIGPKVVITTDIQEWVCSTISGAQLQQLILNLILNARDAADEDRVNVHVALQALQEPPPHRPDDLAADWACLSVSDDGVGMSEEVQSCIFEPFFSSKDYSSSHGAGLGLSVVYGIMEGIGGGITVDSAPGKGTTFSLFFPVAIEDEAQTEEVPAEGFPRFSVLLVEDNHGVRRGIRTMLTRMGLEVFDVESGAEALRLLDAEIRLHPHVLVTDIRMPEMDGYQVAQECRERFEALPVVFMTGFDPDADQRVHFEGSMLLRKPVRRADLWQALRSVLPEELIASGLSRT